MRNRTSLTKSLHTISAVSNLALHLMNDPRHLNEIHKGRSASAEETAERAVRVALGILGQPTDWAVTDETMARCIATVSKKLGG